MMNYPELYRQYNDLTRAGAAECLNEYGPRMKWNSQADSVIDLGSADGSVTSIIKKYVPSHGVKFVGVDISEIMVESAKKHYGDDGITFRLLDVAGELPDDLKDGFNHVFSFFTINCVSNQERTFQNVYKLFTKEGDCLLAFIRTVKMYEMLDQVAQNPKWKSKWLKDIKKFISPYFYMQDPEKNVKDMMLSIGFKNVEVKSKEMTYDLKNGTELKNLMKAVLPFNIPEDVFEELAQDCIPVAKNLGLLDESVNSFEAHDRPIAYNYVLIVAYACK